MRVSLAVLALVLVLGLVSFVDSRGRTVQPADTPADSSEVLVEGVVEPSLVGKPQRVPDGASVQSTLSPDAIATLLARLVHDDPETRVDAIGEVKALLRAGRLAGDRVIGALLRGHIEGRPLPQLVFDELHQVVGELHEQLVVHVGPAVAQAAALDSDARLRALHVIYSLRPLRKEDVPGVVAALEAHPNSEGLGAVLALSCKGDAYAPLLPGLLQWKVNRPEHPSEEQALHARWKQNGNRAMVFFLHEFLKYDAISDVTQVLVEQVGRSWWDEYGADPRHLLLDVVVESRKTEHIVRLLETSDDQLVSSVARELNGQVPLSDRVFDALVHVARTRDASPASGAVCGMRGAGERARPILLELLDHPHTWVRQVAADALGELGSVDQQTVDSLREMISGDDRYDASNAARPLAKAGPAALVALDDLFEAAKTRPVSHYHIASIAAHDPSQLTTRLTSEDTNVRVLAHNALLQLSAPNALQQSLLRTSLRDADSRVRLAAALLLVDSSEAAITEILADALRTEEDSGLIRVLEAIAKRGSAAESLLESLVPIYGDAYDDKLWATIRAASRIIGADYDRLATWLERDSMHSSLARRVLLHHGEAALPHLARWIKPGNPPALREGAAEVLSMYGAYREPSPKAEALLTTLMDDPNPMLRYLSASEHAYGTEPLRDRALQTLLGLMAESDPDVTEYAASRLTSDTDRIPESVLRQLFAHRDHPHPATRAHVRDAELRAKLK